MNARKNFKSASLPTNYIITAVCNALELNHDCVLGADRHRECSEARFIIYHLLRYNEGFGLSQIAKLIGNRNHSTISYGLESFQELLESNDASFKSKIQLVRDELPGVDFPKRRTHESRYQRA
ncbi:MAG: helix-turn-helix domain-containing protein [Arcticibacter sp.]